VSNPDETIDIDIAIIGGGSAGMALATKLEGVSATVFEPKTTIERDCSWALWAQASQLKELKPAIRGSWDQWRLIDHGSEIIHHSQTYRYTSLSSAQYLQHCETMLKKPSLLVRASVGHVVAEGGGGRFTANGRHYSAKTIYDSRPPMVEPNCLRQHFIGWEVILKEPIGDAKVATLMDFRVDQSHGLHFIYVLPYSDRHLLIESTMISTQLEDKDWYRNAIKQWLTDRELEIESVLSEEYGVIPMDTVQPHTVEVNNIGAAAGAVRLSSGYAFSTIQAQMTLLAASIAEGKRTVPEPFSKRLIFLDKVFNRALSEQTDQGVSLFMATANALNADQFSRFMLGRAGLVEWARVILAMPKWPFIKSALKQLLSHD
jgi:lycopene beta-cyclase